MNADVSRRENSVFTRGGAESAECYALWCQSAIYGLGALCGSLPYGIGLQANLFLCVTSALSAPPRATYVSGKPCCVTRNHFAKTSALMAAWLRPGHRSAPFS